MLSSIVCCDCFGGIAKDGRIPWHLPEDLKFFKEKTKGNIVIMGRKTFESIGHPLSDRINIIVTRDQFYQNNGVIIVNSVESCLEICKQHNCKAFVIGGEEIYDLFKDFIFEEFVTEISKDYHCDRFYNSEYYLNSEQSENHYSGNLAYKFIYKRKHRAE